MAKALSVLVAREVLAREAPRYVFDDPFFRRWVQLSSATGAAPDGGPPRLPLGRNPW